MSNTKSYFSQAWGIIMKTTPYLVYRMMVYGIFALAILLWIGLWVFLAWMIQSQVMMIISVIMIIIGFGLGYKLLQRYVLYLLQAGHIAVMTEIMVKGTLPDGVNQTDYGKEMVVERFKEVSVMFAVNELVEGILRMMTRTMTNIASWIPGDSVKNIVNILMKIISRALTYIDEAILSYSFQRPEESPWESARRGVILYGQSWKPILKTAVKVFMLSAVFWFVVFMLLLIPFFGIPYLMEMSTTAQVVGVVAAILFAVLIDAAVFEPFALAYMMVTYNRNIEGLEVNAEWEQRIAGVSDKFKELQQKAAASPGKAALVGGGAAIMGPRGMARAAARGAAYGAVRETMQNRGQTQEQVAQQGQQQGPPQQNQNQQWQGQHPQQNQNQQWQGQHPQQNQQWQGQQQGGAPQQNQQWQGQQPQQNQQWQGQQQPPQNQQWQGQQQPQQNQQWQGQQQPQNQQWQGQQQGGAPQQNQQWQQQPPQNQQGQWQQPQQNQSWEDEE